MKVLYLSNALIPSRQANSMHIMKICSAFSNLGANVTLICRKGESGALRNIHEFYGVNKNIKIHSLKNTKSTLGMYYTALTSLLMSLKTKPDIVVSRFLLSGFLSAFFFNTILELHQMPSSGSRIQKHLLRLISRLPKFKGLVVITRPLKEIFIKNGFPRNLIFILPDGADLKKLPSQPEKTGIEKNIINIGYAGHLFKGRGIEILIDLSKMSNTYMINIAGGNETDILFYKNLIKEEGIKNIKIHGFLEPSRVFDFYCSMDILLSPYQKKVHLQSGEVTTEKWMSPLKIFEYMTSKKPIICSDIDVLKEVLDHRRNCLLCDPEDPNAWNDAIQLLITDKDLADYIAENALKDVKTKFSWNVRAKKILDIAELSLPIVSK